MSSAFDFRRRPSSLPVVGWLLLLAGVAALCIAIAFDRRVAAQASLAARAEEARLELDRQRHQPAKVLEPTAADRRMLHAQAVLQKPWLPTLRAIEAASHDPVYLRMLAIEPATGAVKLEGEASTFADALAYAHGFEEVPVLRSAMLESHQQVSDISGRSFVRFNVTTQWNLR